jgi:hypothetical protein
MFGLRILRVTGDDLCENAKMSYNYIGDLAKVKW